jgi:pimeloyl-ACP methyl ester carboxylesterase
MTRPPSVFIVAVVSTYTTTRSSFDVAGETCAASIHVPVGDHQPQRPGVVLVHGYGCTQNMRLAPYVAGLTGAGLAVLTYDPRNMGQSDGMPRNLVDPDRLVADAQGAVEALRAVGSVASVGIVGFSFGGGVAIEVAAQDPALFALVHVVGFVAGHPRTEAELAALLPAIQADLSVPICGVPGSAAVLPTADAVAGYRLLDVDGTAMNAVPARSLLASAAFAPSLAAVGCPALFIVCDDDLDVDPAATLAAADAHPRSEVITYSGGHFDVFRPGPAGRWARQIAEFLMNSTSVGQAVR